jgi:L-alanine-DL-glutamate epimerase-like enolase superfamily enzyme
VRHPVTGPHASLQGLELLIFAPMAKTGILHTEIFKLPIPMEPFVIATEVSTVAQNTFIRIHTEDGIIGMGECSAFPMLTGETLGTCFEVGKDLARIVNGRDSADIQARMSDMDAYIGGNTTIKSAFDIALHDIAAKRAGLPLYKLLGGERKRIVTDLTIGIDEPENMAATARAFIAKGVGTIKVKLGKDGKEDVKRIRLIREAVGPDIPLRIDANQGWDFATALRTLKELAAYNIEFCEQPIHRNHDRLLPIVRKQSPIPIMADESVCSHYDAVRIIESGGCDYINIKLAKSGGILEAIRIADTAEKYGIRCMLGGMLESRLALTAKVHLAMSHRNIHFYDLDTCLLGQLTDPVVGGAEYDGYELRITDEPGLSADIDPDFLRECEGTVV